MSIQAQSRATVAIAVLASVALLACHKARVDSQSLTPVVCSDSATTDGRLAFSVSGQQKGDQLAMDDWRRPFVGAWHITMTVDSVQTFVHHRSVFRPVQPSCSAAGTLEITDTLVVVREEGALAAHLELDVSRFHGGGFVWPGRVSLRREGNLLQLNLCPGCFDTGVSATLNTLGDSLTGTWREMAFFGHFRVGRMRLWRKES